MNLDDAERWLLDRELFGMRFGLDRMRRLLTVLGSPQERFRAIHVVGSNGKSSTVRYAAALLGARTGSFLSPHLVSFRERIRIGDEDLPADDFARTIERVASAAAKVDRTLEGDDRVTQFEALTAAAYDVFAREGVEAAVVEAGLGGRWDATNVIGAEVVVLTNVGLEHTRWLGPTIRDIAREKLAVVREGATLVLGPDLHPDAREEARAVPAARVIEVAAGEAAAGGAAGGVAPAPFQRRNFAVARRAAEAFLGAPLDDSAVEAAAATRVPGRFEVVGHDPLTILDGAHNPAGVEALAAALADALGGRPLTLVVSVLDDTDAAGMLRSLLPLTTNVVCTSSANPRALSPATLASLTDQLNGPAATLVPNPREALARARQLAGPDGAVLATGSIYLVADLMTEQPAGRRSRL